MRYPQDIIEGMGGAAAFADAATAHPLAPKFRDGRPRELDRAAVYMWKQRDTVPFMWQPVVTDLRKRQSEAA